MQERFFTKEEESHIKRPEHSVTASGSFLDPPLLLLCLAANLFGLLLLYTASRYDPDLHGLMSKQVVASLLGLVAFFLCALPNVLKLCTRLYPLLLCVSLGLLLLLIPFGSDDGSGNKSWLRLPGLPFNLQPAEPVKLIFVLLLALQFCYFEKQGRLESKRAALQTAGFSLFFCALIVLVSADFGMLLVYLFIFLIMAFAAGLRLRWFLAGGLLAGLSGVLLWPQLPPYIQMRALVVFDHGLDPQGKGFQQLRSLLSIGSGQWNGQGYLQGIQTQSSASSSLPARHTDFIFAVAGEEFGFWGCLLILALLSALLLRITHLARHSPSSFGRLMAVGFAGMLAVQTVLNIGMCLFLAPVVGLTLPFFSYGGSSIITMYAAMGLLSSLRVFGRKQSSTPAQTKLP